MNNKQVILKKYLQQSFGQPHQDKPLHLVSRATDARWMEARNCERNTTLNAEKGKHNKVIIILGYLEGFAFVTKRQHLQNNCLEN